MVEAFPITVSRLEGREVQVTVAASLPQEGKKEQTLTQLWTLSSITTQLLVSVA